MAASISRAELTVGSLFSGIGGLDRGLERAGMRVLWQCERDPFCRAVLRKHWPHVPCYEDVKALLSDSQRDGRSDHPGDDGGSREGGAAAASRRQGHQPAEHDRLAGQRPTTRDLAVDVLCGGFPCQPVSLAGRRMGAADERWLWPEFARLIRLLRPRYAVMENVPGLLVGGGMAEVLGDLAACGYDAEWDCIPAAAVGAPHLRYRVFIVAYPQGDDQRPGLREGKPNDNGRRAGSADSGGSLADSASLGSQGREPGEAGLRIGSRAGGGGAGTLPDPDSAGRREQRGRLPIFTQLPAPERGGWWSTEPDVGRVAHGVPSRVDRLRALGNAVVPQVAEAIGRMIVEAENGR